MESESPLSVFESASVVRVRPGDVLLFRCPERLTDARRAHATKVLNEVFPNHETMILDGGQDVAILRPEPGFFARLFRRRQGSEPHG